jgi:hypothetical protein
VVYGGLVEIYRALLHPEASAAARIIYNPDIRLVLPRIGSNPLTRRPLQGTMIENELEE